MVRSKKLWTHTFLALPAQITQEVDFSLSWTYLSPSFVTRSNFLNLDNKNYIFTPDNLDDLFSRNNLSCLYGFDIIRINCTLDSLLKFKLPRFYCKWILVTKLKQNINYYKKIFPECCKRITFHSLFSLIK